MSPPVVARKIAQISNRTARVRELLPATPEAFEADRTAAEALIFNLFLALQEASDLAMHVVAERGLGVPGSTREAFELLATHALVEPELGRKLAAAVGLRNRIAHEYGTLDPIRVFQAARDDLPDLEAFAARIATAYGI